MPYLLDLLVDKMVDAVAADEFVRNDPDEVHTPETLADTALEVEIAGWALAVYDVDHPNHDV